MLTFAPHVVRYQGGDQTLRTIPLDTMFRPAIVSSATYTIEDLRKDKDASDRIIASGTATQGASSYTLAAAAGPSQADATKITLSSPTSISWEGVYVLLLSVDGTRELAQIRAQDATDTILWTDHPIRRDYAIGDTLRGIELRCTFPAAAAADEDSLDDKGGPMAVMWEWTADDGRVDKLREMIWLRRQTRAKVVWEQQLIKRWPAVARWGGKDDMIRNALDAAHEDYWVELSLAGLPWDRYYTCDMGMIAITSRALYYLHAWRETDDSNDLAERFNDEWRRQIQSLTNGRPGMGVVKVSEDDSAPSGSNHGYEGIFIET